MKATWKTSKVVLALALAVGILLTALIAGVDTSWGQVEVRLGKLISENGGTINYKLYIPKTATAENPVPAVLYGAGGGDSLDAGRSFGIEASRRGMVAMTIDVPGNGLSQSTASVVRFDANNQAILSKDDPTQGHELAYQYLTSLPFVDKTRMITGGHSMGGSYTVQVAQNHPDEVQLQVNIGMNMYGDAAKGYDFNFALIMGSSDESSLVRTTNYSNLDEVLQHASLKGIFGLPEDERIEIEKVYGDFAAGNGRMLRTPHTLHIWEPYSVAVVENFLELVDMSIEVPKPLDHTDTVFKTKDYLMIAWMIVFTVFVAAVACTLLDSETFRCLRLKAREYKGFKSGTKGWWIAVALLAILCGYSVIWCYMQTGGGKAPFFTQYGNSGAKCIWSLVTGGSLLIYMIAWYLGFGKKAGADLADMGFATSDEGGFHICYLGKALVFAVTLFAIAIGYFLAYYYVTKSNIQWIMFEISPISANRMGSMFPQMMLCMLPFVLMNAVAQRTVISYDEGNAKSTVKALIVSNLICVLLIAIIHIVFVCNAYFAYRTIFPINRGYIGGEQIMGLAVGTLIINTIGFFLSKKTNTVWVTVLATLPLVAWFQVVAAGAKF